ncbi:hypothetical protein AHF37_01973 [Paragonimus kellicotti]|nr:hypothetical protein AHF37_01973 [Paragonimus kellicotti]
MLKFCGDLKVENSLTSSTDCLTFFFQNLKWVYNIPVWANVRSVGLESHIYAGNTSCGRLPALHYSRDFVRGMSHKI